MVSRSPWKIIAGTAGPPPEMALAAATLPHGGECGGHVSGGAVGEAGMDSDRRIQIAVGCSHDSRSGASGRQSGDIDALWINRIVVHDLAGDARDQRGLAFAARWSAARNQFQHFDGLASLRCAG